MGRHQPEPALQDAMRYASEGAFNFPLSVREGCMRGGDFQAGSGFLAKIPLISPGYFIIAGAAPGEGVILTRNATADGTDMLHLKDGYPKTDPWFLVQTNYDHWTAAPKYDDRR